MNVGFMPSNRSAFTFDNEEDDDEMYNLIHDMCERMSIDAFTSETNIEENVDMTHDDNREFTMCAGFLEKAGKSLFPSSKLSALSFIVKLMHIKVLNKLSNKAIDMILQLFKEAFPKGTILPSTTYDAKKLLKDLGLGHTTWDIKWHQEKRVAEEGILRHPPDEEA
ncbi:hypothetical protein WN944_010763 [Citrus x changshan-huyou]|uniref:Uncharacterized protein n=1 Tax=Citrus x changshan-huyou TaxID=2935761 RepID=A0AAP0QXK0_9ROSI